MTFSSVPFAIGEMTVSAPTVLPTPPISSNFAYVRDRSNGWDLFTTAPDTSYDTPASLVKLATALILMERKSGVLDSGTATVAAGDIVNGTTANLQSGDVLTWRHLLSGMMIPSGNDAATCAARIIGTEIFDQTGSGNTGVTRFIEEMNAHSANWGLTATTFNSADGIHVSETNPTTAKDIGTLARFAWNDPTIRGTCATPSWTMVITGANARTYSVTNANRLINGPINNPSGIKMDNVLAAKGGTNSAETKYSMVVLWRAPAGQEVMFVLLDSVGSGLSGDRYLDFLGMVYQVVNDYRYLTNKTSVGTDSQFSSVVLLTGAEQGAIDESNVGRTLTSNGAQRSSKSPLVGNKSYLFNGTSDYISMDDAADMSFGTSDFAVEFYFSGSGSEPSDFAAFVSKWNTSSQREWSIQYDPSTNLIIGFVSGNGVGFSQASFNLSNFGMSAATFFNGGKRHIMLRRNGSDISIYVMGMQGDAPFTIGAASLFSGTAKPTIGARDDGGGGAEFFIGGRIDEVRITNGNARQTAAMFTPSGREYPRS